VDFLLPACPEVIRDCSGTVASDAKIRPLPPFGRHIDRTAAISAFLIINKHYHIPTIGGPHSLVVLMLLVTWRGKKPWQLCDINIQPLGYRRAESRNPVTRRRALRKAARH
jgi:hypothetical protein